ncbi:MAG: succinate dehydrogenase cytochrome b subunit [Actinobacteria bacterium]|nr:succinate dehydrogenase cytochrome b subunit [Actinomycetota bacterium]
MPTPTPTESARIDPTRRAPRKQPRRSRRSFWLLELYRSALGKKYVMALTGIVLLAFVLAHMIGNFKLYVGEDEMNHYAEWLRGLMVPALPETVFLWMMRSVLIASFVFHVHASYALTVMNRRARTVPYQSRRDYVAANFAARTMRWSGVIVGLFVVFHLADLTWGFANPGFDRGEVYDNVVVSFSRWPVSLFYIAANIALAYHIYHGAWSLFQSMGWNAPRFNRWRNGFAVTFAVVIGVGNVSFPIAVLGGLVR